ncbi:MAG TPA: amino acid ABC transporter substrate-binding protein [Stellaceae bacterium]|nr:amino acid ABC transporter substrate-binding protein [Stellaceae bacterium]
MERGNRSLIGSFVVLLATLALATAAAAQEPIKIGFSMALTGGGAANGKVALLAMKIWEADVNAKGGLLGRPVKLVYYDDQTQPANVPGIYTKLLDVDKVELIAGPYSTIMNAPLMPIAMAHNMVVVSLTALGVNDTFHYPKYFSSVQTGPNATVVFSKGFFDVAAAQNPAPKTVALASSDQEFSRNAADGARANAKAHGMTIVYDKSYPPPTTDFSPIVRAVQAANPDLFFIASYPPDSVGMLKSLSEVGFKPKMVGGAMVGLNNTTIKMQIGPLLNGVVGYENWLPLKPLLFPGVEEMLKKYQAQAQAEGVDPLGYNTATSAYAYLQVLEEGVRGANSLDQDKIADWLHKNELHTVLGEFRYGPDGEWDQSRFLTVQYRNITGKTLDQFSDPSKVAVVDPPKYKTGDLIYPYADAVK